MVISSKFQNKTATVFKDNHCLCQRKTRPNLACSRSVSKPPPRSGRGL